jgi:tRNA(fMet)-specific endonuclease VapC
MFILDTDHLSVLEWGGAESLRLQERLTGQPPEEVATTIINFEEQMRGWLAYVARARSLPQQVEAYHRLRQHLDNYRLIPILDFDERAAAELACLQKGRVRIGTMDLKIAAIALSQGATLLTRNLNDFGRVPGLEVEDWTQ